MFGEGNTTFQSFLEKESISLVLVGFYTIASPHLGVARYNDVVKGAFDLFGGFAGLTGKQLCLYDNEKFMDILAGDDYIDSLKKFRLRTLVGDVFWDLSVPFPTALIRSDNIHINTPANESTYEFELVGVSFKNFDKAHFVHQKKAKDCGNISTPSLSDDNWFYDDNKLMRFSKFQFNQLNQLDWRRIEVNFHNRLPPIVLPIHFMIGKAGPLSFSFLPTVKKGMAGFNDFLDFFTNVVIEDHTLLSQEKNGVLVQND